MAGYALIAGLKPRPILALPLLTPSLSSQWVAWSHRSQQHRPAAGGKPDQRGRLQGPRHRRLRARPRGRSHRLRPGRRADPAAHPGPPRHHVLVLGRGRRRAQRPAAHRPGLGRRSLYVDERAYPVEATADQLWTVITGIGGSNGWYSWRLGWWGRGLLDRLVGGPGLRRGRRDPVDLSVGDPLDWWRVEDIEDNHLLRLRAEMRLPGLAWLELIVHTDHQGRTLFRQRALFHPRGLDGHDYWTMVYPFHGLVFGGMQRNIARAAQHATASRRAAPGLPARPSWR